MRDPHTTSLAHQRVQRDSDTTRRGFHRDAAILVPTVEVGLTVGHDHKGARDVYIQFASLAQPAAKQNRSDEFVNRD